MIKTEGMLATTYPFFMPGNIPNLPSAGAPQVSGVSRVSGVSPVSLNMCILVICSLKDSYTIRYEPFCACNYSSKTLLFIFPRTFSCLPAASSSAAY